MESGTDRARVEIWTGSEWPPLRAAFILFLDGLGLAEPDVTVLSESVDPSATTGRIAGWIRAHRAESGGDVLLAEPGIGVLSGHRSDRRLIGITELLLDPDPAQAEQLYAIGIWTRVIPRRKRWLMRVTPHLTEEIVGNAATGGPDLLFQVAEWCGQRVIIASQDLIAAEVVGRALRAIAQPAGDVGINPWETEIVRVASERNLGVTSGSRIRILVSQAGRMPPGAAAEFRAIAESLARLIDCEVEFLT